MDSGSKIYRLRYNLPMHTVPWLGPSKQADVTPRGTMAQGRLIASRSGAILVSPATGGELC
jgi:hypothetical protein